LGLAGESIVEADRLRELGTLLASIRAGQAAMADMLDELGSQPGAMHRNSAVGRGLAALRLQLQNLRLDSSEWFEAFAGHARRSEQLGARLFREASDTRMRPLGDALASFPRLVRDLTRRLGKQAELTIDGEAIRIDRDILERIEAPLNHLLRNALDHGIEPAALRVAVGKPERATLGIRARMMAGFIHLEVSDDGAGIDTDKVRARVVEMALASPEAVSTMGDERLFDFLFVSGFTTTTRVTEISGRGIGLAVVRSVMRDIGGAVHIRSQRGQGSCFTLQVPVSRSVLRSVIVSIGGEPYAFGLSSVARILRVSRDQVRTVNGQRYLAQGDQTLALVDTASALALASATLDDDPLHVVVISARPHDFGFVVEGVRGQHDLVLQPLDSRLGRIPDVSAAAILPDGQPVVVLDANDLCRSVLTSSAGTDGSRTPSLVTSLPQRRRILVVDDSPTVKETQRDALARAGYDVATASDGLEAWHMLRGGAFDLLVSDVDMPRLDGIGLVRSVRQEQRLRTLPVVMVSYRGSAEDRETALAAGADVYLLKANFDEQQLYDAVIRLIGGPERP
jgi:two-component system sensor histidine kinase and response regulator WspE